MLLASGKIHAKNRGHGRTWRGGMGPAVEIAACEGEGARERAASRRAAESIRAIIVVVVRLIVIIVLNGYVCKKAVVHAPVSNA